jgi:DNA-binding Lrp family transcriptional regulator
MEDRRPVLSEVDKSILKVLLTPDGRHSSKQLARQLGLPATTVQRRHKRLENEYLRIMYTLDLTKFGWHKVDFLVATESGRTDAVGRSLLKRDEVIYVGKSIGQQTIDLRVETILKDNSAILSMLELLKGTAGVRDVVWTEIVEVVGTKMSVPSHIIDKL